MPIEMGNRGRNMIMRGEEKLRRRVTIVEQGNEREKGMR